MDDQNRVYGDIQNDGVKLAIIKAYRNLIIMKNAGYKMVCTTYIYTVSEFGYNTNI